MEADNKKYKVIVSDGATQMLVTHARFLAKVSEKAANDLIAEFTKKATSLESFPGRNPWADDSNLPERKYRKLPLGKWLLMLYQVRSDSIYVDYVVDCRQDYGWLQ